MNYLPFINLKSILNSLNINFVEKGDELQARCMSGKHEDKNPSWSINKNTGLFHCFSCGYSGNIVSLIKDLTGQTIQQYLKLDDPFSFMFRASLYNQTPTKQEHKTGITKTILNIQGQLLDPLENKQVMKYLESRYIDKNFIKDFNINYCDKTIINGTTFKNRILIPIVESDIVVSYEGRTFVLDKPKVLYPKDSSVNTLFNIDNIDKKKDLILVEGIMDIPKIYTHITKNVTCIFGASITNRQLKLLNEYENLIIIPDNDKAGKILLEKLDENLTEREFQVAKLTNSKDPGDATLEEIQNALLHKKTMIETLIDDYFYRNRSKLNWRL